MNLAFWRSGRQAERVAWGAPRPQVVRPWQLKQWFAPFSKVAASIETRQIRRAAFRSLSFKQITEQYGGEPRHARRGIAMTLARRAYLEYKKTA